MKMTEGERTFAAVCYVTLMNSHDGTPDKAPTYFHEKLPVLNGDPDFAYACPDRVNQLAVLRWAERWHFKLPEDVQR